MERPKGRRLVVQGDTAEEAFDNADHNRNVVDEELEEGVCWERPCKEKSRYRLFKFVPQGMAECFLCPKHAILQMNREPDLLLEELDGS